jgi:phosphoribosylamine---glycine ligase
MKVLVIGSGGREHALIWKLRQSPRVERIYCTPGNGGIARDATCVASHASDPQSFVELAKSLGADLTVVGPEAPLVAGVADEFAARGLGVAGPNRAAARLEGSKIFAKEFLHRHGIPTADFLVCEDWQTGRANLGRWGGGVVIKADGLAAGKGVVVCSESAEAETALQEMLSGRLVGDAGRRVLLEEKLEGEEVSFLALTDGKTVLPLAPTQDHKRVWDDDRGPNTGGMGAYSDDGILSAAMSRRILDEIVFPTLEGLRREGIPYKGVLYSGLMITPDGPKVLEYNVRFGDPETQPLMLRLEGDLAETLLALARGELGSDMLSWKAGASVCVVACSAGYPGSYTTGKVISGLEEAEAGGACVFHAGTAQQDGRIVTSGGRVLGITAAGADLASATQAAYQAAAKVRFEGIHYRHDIARKGLQRPRPL